MKNSIFYKKMIVLNLATVLLVFCIQGIGFSQLSAPPSLSVDQIYDKTIRSLVWIVSKTGQGSGVLIDGELRLAATNHHVVKDDDQVAVFFPVRDLHGVLIDERDFYLDKDNLGVLSRLGYATTGRIVAKEPKTDMAIVELAGLPDTAREIEHNFNYPAYLYMDKDEKIQIFGNPGGLKLWKWAAGFFQTVDQGMIKINAGIYKGNSGGPVLDEQGRLIGIATLSNERHTTWAVPAKYIKDLLNTLQPRHVFSIQNNTNFTVSYAIKWLPNGSWRKSALRPGYIKTHWNGYVSQGYPKVSFDYIANDKKSTPRKYHLKTYRRNFGAGVEPSSTTDAREYHFGYNSRTNILDLYDSQKK